MKELICELPYSKELEKELNDQINDFGQIPIGDRDDVFIELMPVNKKNFINDIQPVIDVVVNYSTQIALGIFVNWLFSKLNGSQTIILDGKKYKVDTKETLERILEELNNEK